MLTPYHSILAKYRPYITTDLLQAKKGCRKCKGRGHEGFNLTTKTHVPCRCVMVDMDKLLEVMKTAAAKIETNIPSLMEQPGPEHESV